MKGRLYRETLRYLVSAFSSHTAQTCVDFVIKDSIVLADLCSAPCLGLRVLSSRCTFGIFLYHDATSTPTRLKMRAKGGMRVLVM